MNNRWAARILGVLMIIVFVLVMMYLQRQLVLMQQHRNPQTTTAPKR